MPRVPTIDVSELPAEAFLLDVREQEEWDAGHIEGALHVPMNSVPQHAAYGEQITRERQVVVLCKMGGRSAQVAAWLNQQGFDAVNLEGGMLAWAAAGRPLVSADGSDPYVA